MSEPDYKEDENRALAFAALSLVKALVSALETKGILEGSDVQAVFDQALTTMEHRPQDAATDLARRIIEGTAIAHATQPPRDPDGPN